jgi:gas vesicle protein GvpL/GvpF
VSLVYYVYGIVPRALDAAETPPGLDDAPVVAMPVADMAALVSRMDAGTYDPSAIEARVAEIGWLAPRAVAHDAVVTWASERGPVVPFPMWVLCRDLSSLDARAGEFRRALGRVAPGREYAVRVFRLDGELAVHLAAMSPEIAALEASAAQSAPGQRYLLERKLESERKDATRRVSASVGDEIYASLRAAALDAATDPLPAPTPTRRDPAVLNAAFLVGHDALEPFQSRLTILVRRYEPLGFRFEFTGPWPPYHFVGSR